MSDDNRSTRSTKLMTKFNLARTKPFCPSYPYPLIHTELLQGSTLKPPGM